MNGLIVTSTQNSFKVEFNDYAQKANMVKGAWNKSQVIFIRLMNGFVTAQVFRESEWILTFDGDIGFKVDNVNGVTCNSNEELFSELCKIIQ